MKGGSNLETTLANSSLAKANAFNQERTYNYLANTAFYSLTASTPYNFYYQRMVREYFYWYDGYNPFFHKTANGMFSTKIASVICKRIAEQVFGGKLMFDNKATNRKKKYPNNGAKKFMEAWSEENDLSNQLQMAGEWAFAGGDSLMKLNYDGSDLWVSKHRKDTYLINTDFRGRITDTKILMYEFTKMITEKSRDTEHYYLLEHRYMKGKTPFIQYFIKRGRVSAHRGTNVDMNLTTIDFGSLPRTIRDRFVETFPKIRLGKPYKLPFEGHLGVYMMKATESVSNLPDSPFGESILSNILSYLRGWDYYYSAMMTDLYIGRGRIIVPKSFQAPHVSGGSEESNSHFSALPSEVFTKIPNVNPQDSKITNVQFDLRMKEWTELRDNLIQSMATSIGIDVRTLASFINDSTNTTKTEIDSENDSTILFVENKRNLFKCVIDAMLEDICNFYGYKDSVSIRFSQTGLVNINNVVTQVTTLKQNFLIDDETALEWVFVDKDDAAREEMLKRINEQRKAEAELNRKETEAKSMQENDVTKKETNTASNTINHTKKNK